MINYIRSFFIMKEVFDGKLDSLGKDYSLIPIAVATSVESVDAKTVAILHDVVVETDFDFEELFFLEENVLEALDVLIIKDDEDYLSYIERLKANELAREVKLAVLKNRMKELKKLKLTPAQQERLDEYKKAINILEK